MTQKITPGKRNPVLTPEAARTEVSNKGIAVAGKTLSDRKFMLENRRFRWNAVALGTLLAGIMLTVAGAVAHVDAAKMIGLGLGVFSVFAFNRASVAKDKMQEVKALQRAV